MSCTGRASRASLTATFVMNSWCRIYTFGVFFVPTIPVTDCRDAKDNKYLELALAAQAEAIVSSDTDLLVLHPWSGVRILWAVEYLAFVGEPR